MVFVILLIVCLLVITLTVKFWKLNHQVTQHNQHNSEVFFNKKICLSYDYIFFFIFSLLKCQHYVIIQYQKHVTKL